MRFLVALVWLLVLAPPAHGAEAPAVTIKAAVARIVLVPEARADIAVTVAKASPAFPLRITRSKNAVSVVGDTGRRSLDCRPAAGGPIVEVRGRGDVRYDDMPSLVIRVPLNVRLSVAGAVFGAIGRSRSLDLSNQGCGDWLIGNVASRMRLSQSGSGAVRAGSAGAADLSVAGSGNIHVGAVGGGLRALSTGAGDIGVMSVAGPLDARIAGAGNIVIPSGRVTDMSASIAGSGSVRFGGVAHSLHAEVEGSGVITAAAVAEPVAGRIFGSGAIHAGRPGSPRR